MFVECVTVCVNFSDVLAHAMPLNRHNFDDWVVVTDAADQATRDLCRHHHVRWVSTDEFYRDEHAFNKGRGINAGLQKMTGRDWVLHLDADVVLPPRFRSLLERVVKPMDDCVYGIDRMMCPSFEAWLRHVTRPAAQHTDEIFVDPRPFPLGARVAKLDGEGYVPIGFFQLWNAGATGIMDYPTTHGTAGRTDMLHALRWPRQKRVLIPEFIGIHLEGEMPEGRRNWRGRVMKPFEMPTDVAGYDRSCDD